MVDENRIKEKIREIHSGDDRQLEVIFSDKERIIVEAPAGYGKTTTMVSRLAYLYSIQAISNPKKILGLTFSVNAALKIKRDIASKLPRLINQNNDPTIISNTVTVTNYHGFCKSVLKKYGRLVNALLIKDLNLFRAVGEDDIKKFSELNSLITSEEAEILFGVDDSIKSGLLPSNDKTEKYIEIISEKFLPKDIVTHTAILLMALKLFEKKEIAHFYQNYYSIIVVDEFQDTNVVAWEIIKRLIGSQTQLLFLGDSLQRIYGFIGALPRIMEIAEKEYSMTAIPLVRNYRFKDNENMLNLDFNLRENAKTELAPSISNIAEVPAFWASTHEGEAKHIANKIIEIRAEDNRGKIAILSRARSYDIDLLEEQLEESDIDYFYGMFTDDDEEYVKFHLLCQQMFIKQFGKRKTITNHSLKKFTEKIAEAYDGNESKITSSLLELLNAFTEKVESDYNDLLPEEKYEYILDVFENRQLKQSMEYVKADVILSTIHGAKGLEWDYVFIMDIERWIFPGYPICKDCDSKWNKGCYCTLPQRLNDSILNNLLDELSVFYVAVTRARKQVYLSASGTRYNNDLQKKESLYSCFARLKGIKLFDASK